MHKIKVPALLFIAILIGGAFSSATAQRRLPPIEPPAAVGLSGSYKVAVKADKISNGEVEFRTPATFGWTCYGTTEGDLTGYIFISMNYDAPVPSLFGGEVRNVTGGSWSKLIFDKGEYAGSINGRIVSGQLVNAVGVVSVDGSNTTIINLQLAGDAGTGLYAGNFGSGVFEGVLDQTTKGSSVTGTLYLNY